jgi:hypothetical protein
VKELSDDPVDLSDKRFWRALKDQQLLDALDLRGRLIPLIGPIRPLRLPLGLIDELVDDLGRAEVHTYVEACGSDDSYFWRWLMATSQPLNLDDRDLRRAEADFFAPRGSFVWFHKRVEKSTARKGAWQWNDVLRTKDPADVQLTEPLLEDLLGRAGFPLDDIEFEGRLDLCRHASQEWTQRVVGPPVDRYKRKRPPGAPFPAPGTGEPFRLSLMDVLTFSEKFPSHEFMVNHSPGVDPLVFVNILASEWETFFAEQGMTVGAKALLRAAWLLCGEPG